MDHRIVGDSEKVAAVMAEALRDPLREAALRVIEESILAPERDVVRVSVPAWRALNAALGISDAPWADNGLAALDELDRLYYDGAGPTVAEYRAATDAIRTALLAVRAGSRRR